MSDDYAVDQVTRVGLSLKMANDVDAILAERLTGNTFIMEQALQSAFQSGHAGAALRNSNCSDFSYEIGRSLTADPEFMVEIKRVIRQEIRDMLHQQINKF